MREHLYFSMLLHDESGVTSIEYALMGALIAMAIVASVTTLGLSLKELYKMVAGKVCATVGCSGA